MWVRIRSYLWRQCETWVWFLTSTWKWICKLQKPAKTPTIISRTSGESENSGVRKPRARLYMHLLRARIDYCNSLMNGLPENLIKKLQRVQNTAARLVFNLRKYDRITPALVTLHWLPVKYWFEFKTLLIVFKGLHGKAPTYIQGMITLSKSKRYSIRSNEERVLKVPKFKHDTFGKRAFAVYGPLAWNCLPKEIRLCDEIEAFKRILKTHLFVKFVNESTLAVWFWRIIVKRPRILSAQFVALYKPCKPKPNAQGQFICQRWILLTKASDVELWCFLLPAPD